jgi:hypothetical protein
MQRSSLSRRALRVLPPSLSTSHGRSNEADMLVARAVLLCAAGQPAAAAW